MSLLGERDLVRRRFGATTWSAGRASVGASTDTPFRGSLQPMPERDRDVLPEGIRTRDARKVYCPRGTLRTDDQRAGLPADQVLDGGVAFTVIHVDSSHELLPHDRAYLLRTQEPA